MMGVPLMHEAWQTGVAKFIAIGMAQSGSESEAYG